MWQGLIADGLGRITGAAGYYENTIETKTKSNAL